MDSLLSSFLTHIKEISTGDLDRDLALFVSMHEVPRENWHILAALAHYRFRGFGDMETDVLAAVLMIQRRDAPVRAKISALVKIADVRMTSLALDMSTSSYLRTRGAFLPKKGAADFTDQCLQSCVAVILKLDNIGVLEYANAINRLEAVPSDRWKENAKTTFSRFYSQFPAAESISEATELFVKILDEAIMEHELDQHDWSQWPLPATSFPATPVKKLKKIVKKETTKAFVYDPEGPPLTVQKTLHPPTKRKQETADDSSALTWEQYKQKVAVKSKKPRATRD